MGTRVRRQEAARRVLFENTMSQTQDQPSEASRRMDLINRRAWSDGSTVRAFRYREGWTDPGERAALRCVRADAVNQPILDLGVGAGRTVPMLREISADYVGLDYTPELVRACRQKHPGARIIHGDARDLSQFADGSFQLVVFSFNGIDAVNADDRFTILREARRVLRPGGALLFSSHNRNGPGHGEKLSFGVNRTRNPVKLAQRFMLAVLHAAQTVRNYENYSKLSYDADDYSIRNASAHNHGIVIHYISLQSQLRQLDSIGFQPNPIVFASSDGRQLAPGDDTSDAWWFHVVVRK
jgi:ubiquinone/menaquinone biosynthesis C-methylase UbiE